MKKYSKGIKINFYFSLMNKIYYYNLLNLVNIINIYLKYDTLNIIHGKGNFIRMKIRLYK